LFVGTRLSVAAAQVTAAAATTVRPERATATPALRRWDLRDLGGFDAAGDTVPLVSLALG
jgi:hypothetical protein